MNENFFMTDVCFTEYSMMELYQTILLLCCTLIISVESLMFHLEANARFEFIDLYEEPCVTESVVFRKCLAEEIRNGVLVTGDYTVTEMAGQQVVR